MRRTSTLFSLGFAALVMLVITGCGGSTPEPTSPEFDRAALLSQWADQSVVPAYEAWSGSATQLAAVTLELVGMPSAERVEEVRDAYRAACLAWQRVALFDFGPAADRALLSTTNTFPVDTAGVLEDISVEEWAPGTPSSLSRMGLPALDFLLFSQTPNALVNELEENPLLGQHLLRLTGHMGTEAAEMVGEWTGGYRDAFVAATGTEMGSSLGAVLNAFNRTYEGNLRKQKLGLPAGISTFSQTPLPGHVEAPFAGDMSVDLMQEAFSAYRDLYNGVPVQGDGNLGLDDYLRSLGDTEFGQQLDADIQAQLVSTEAALNRLENPLAEYVVDQQQDAFEVYAELQALVVLWKVDMMSALGILVTYQDNDGD